MKNEVTDNSERSSSVSAGSLRVVVPRRRAPADGETTVRIACSQEVHCMVTGPWSSGCFRAGDPPTPRRSRDVSVRSYRRRTTGFRDIVGKHSKPTAACPACAVLVVRTPTSDTRLDARVRSTKTKTPQSNGLRCCEFRQRCQPELGVQFLLIQRRFGPVGANCGSNSWITGAAFDRGKFCIGAAGMT